MVSCMHDRLFPNGVCSGSRHTFKFSQTNDNILETVQDTDVLTTEH